MRERIVNYLSLTFAVFLVIGTLTIAYIQLIPVNILKNWRITSTEQSYKVGDQVILNIEYEKIRESAATTYYSLECKRPNGSLKTYPLFHVEAKKKKSSGTVKVPVDLPKSIADTPTDCRVAIKAYYHVFTLRDVLEENVSNYFEVHK